MVTLLRRIFLRFVHDISLSFDAKFGFAVIMIVRDGGERGDDAADRTQMAVSGAACAELVQRVNRRTQRCKSRRGPGQSAAPHTR